MQPLKDSAGKVNQIFPSIFSRKKKPESWVHPRHSRGLQSPRYFGVHVKAVLTDKQISKYIESGFYTNRAIYRRELAQRKSQTAFLRKMVYDCEKQDFVWI